MGRRRVQGQAGERLPLAWGAATSWLADARRPRPLVLLLRLAGGHVHSGPWYFTMWLPHLDSCPLALIDHPTRRISRKPMNRFATAFFDGGVTIILHR